MFALVFMLLREFARGGGRYTPRPSQWLVICFSQARHEPDSPIAQTASGRIGSKSRQAMDPYAWNSHLKFLLIAIVINFIFAEGSPPLKLTLLFD